METIREKIILLRQALSEYDSLTDNIVASRIKLEQIRRQPELGQKVVGQNRDGTPEIRTVVTAKMLKDNIAHLRNQKAQALKVLVYLVGLDTEDIEEIRDAFTKLLMAHTRVGTLREQISGLEIGMDYESLDLPDSFNDGTRNDAFLKLRGRLADAEEALVEIAARFDVPEVSDIEIPRLSLEP